MSRKKTKSPEKANTITTVPNLTGSPEEDLHALIHHLFYLEIETKRLGKGLAANLIGAAAEELTDELMDGANFAVGRDASGTKVTLPH